MCPSRGRFYVLTWGLLINVGLTAPNLKLEEVHPNQLLDFLSAELNIHDQKSPEALYHLNEFQDVSEMDCDQRLFYLMNETVVLRDAVTKLHSDIMGLAGIFIELLRHVQESTWVWLLTTSQERVLQKVQTYFFRVMALSVDQHPCMKALVRDVLLVGIEAWKELQVDLLALQWHSFAFSFYRDPAFQGSAGTVEESFVAGTYWLTKLQDWMHNYTRQVYEALLTLEGEVSSMTAGPIRLHHQDEHGSFVTYEFMRRKVFKQWAIDKGLLRGLLRHVWQPDLEEPLAIGDFGAGGGHYSQWLNETGLLEAFAFDGTHQAAELTDGLVQEVNLVEEMTLWRTFDWILCLEVGEHVPKPFAPTLLANLKRHATKGLVMSWSDDWEGIGHVNCLSREDFVAFVQDSTGFRLDATATELVRQACEIDYIARTLAVFRAPDAGP
ncbi:unnamed protein product [Durusdinium trenchii]|uniref:Uncharacterized protein n=2 Tax=Durusdinium trenchii TaxID=1381693 RepID=A0ABP0HPP7_9DINO